MQLVISVMIASAGCGGGYCDSLSLARFSGQVPALPLKLAAWLARHKREFVGGDLVGTKIAISRRRYSRQSWRHFH